MSRGASLAGVLGLSLLVLFSARLAHVSRAEYAEAEHAIALHDDRAAIVHLRRAARLVTPFGRASDARDRLRSIALAAEGRGDVETALAAHRAVRGAIVGSRSFFPLATGELEAADARIAELAARSAHAPSTRGLDEAGRAREHRALLRETPSERAPLVLLASASFLYFVRTAHRLLARYVGRDPRPSRRDVLAALSLLLVFLVSARFA